jgi:hypothetical protein
MSGLILRIAVLSAVLSFWSGTLFAEGLPSQTSTQAAVTVKVTPRSLQGEFWDFNVVFDTHSQDLQDDLLKSAVLVKGDGTSVQPIAWEGPAPGGHHREGILRFNALNPAPDTVVLRISRPGEKDPRSFQWEKK